MSFEVLTFPMRNFSLMEVWVRKVDILNLFLFSGVLCWIHPAQTLNMTLMCVSSWVCAITSNKSDAPVTEKWQAFLHHIIFEYLYIYVCLCVCVHICIYDAF